MNKYNEQLIQETIQTFKEEDGVEFSREQAIEALDNLGGYF
jgi:hypothetical protein